MSVRWWLRFEPRDCWIGLYWTRRGRALMLYICVLPMLPIVVEIRTEGAA